MISAIYIFVGSCIVVAARTRYQWGEPINFRHTLQYTPFVLGILLTIVLGQSVWLSKIRWFLAAILVFSHATYALSSVFVQKESGYPLILKAYKTGEGHLCVKEKGFFLVSNFAEVFRIECGAWVRNINHISRSRNKELLKLMDKNEGYSSLMDAIADIKNKAVGRPIHIGFFPGKFGLEASDFPVTHADQLALLNSGWTIILNDERGILIQIDTVDVGE